MTQTRLITAADAAPLAALRDANDAFLAPYEPDRPRHTGVEDQARTIQALLDGYHQGTVIPHVILDEGRIIGRITISNIVRFSFQSGTVGYWVAEADNGRGHASAALAQTCALAFGELELHRLEAGTLVDNVRSQRVLERNRFTRIGRAPGYLKIAGRWQDHVLFQRLAGGG